MSEFLSFAIAGVPFGCVFALMAVGLVLAYQTSGVFNLAFGAQAYASALMFYEAVANGWPKWAAFVAAVLVVSPGLGLMMDRLLFRHIRSAPVLVKLVSGIGMLITIPSVIQLLFGNGGHPSPPDLLLSPTQVYFRLGGEPIDGTQLSTVVVTALAVLILALVFHFTVFGLRMRAMAESPRMVQLTGANAERIGGFTWALSSMLAGLAGVLLAPALGQVQSLDFLDLLVAGIAAAAVGSLTSLPLTFGGGVALGVAEEILGGYLPSGSVLSSGLRYAFPFVALVGLLLFMPGLRRRWVSGSDPMSGIDPPPPPLASTIRPPGLERLMTNGLRLLVALFVVSCLTVMPDNWLIVLTQGLAYSVIFLSITLLTGMSGQISLCQMAFAGAGAFAAGQLAMHFNISVLAGVILGGLVAAALGALVAIPALRLGGLALAIATLAFGFLADNIGFQYSWSGNGLSGVPVPRPALAGIDFTSDKSYFLLVFVVLVLAATVVHLVRRGTTGRYLAAMRGSELAAAAVGINLNRWKVVVFALSAGLAGVGGALYSSINGSAAASDYTTFQSLVFLVVVVTTGVRTVEGAIQAGLGYVVIAELLTYLHSPRWANLLEILFGLGAITYALHPEGIVELQKRRWIERVVRLRSTTGADPDGPGGGGGGARGGSGASAAEAASRLLSERLAGPGTGASA